MARPRGRWSIARAAVLVTGLTALSTLLGFARDVVLGAVFGAGAGLDAYLVAQGLMSIVLALIAGAMARSVTPVTAREAAAETDGCTGHRGFDVALTLTLAVLGVGGVLMGIFVGPVTAVLAPGFDDAQAATVQSLTRIVLVATVLVAGTNLLAALAQAHGRFAWSSLEGVPFNLVMVAAAGLFGPRYGVTALAVGFVVGSGARLLLQVIPLRALGTPVRARWDTRDAAFREIARLAPPMMVGSALANVNTLVDRAFASTLTDGSITALSYGWRLVNLPEALLIASLLVPLYPALGAAAGDPAEVRRLVGRGLSVTVTLLVPLCVVLALVAVPAVDVAFGHGAFDADDVAATATAVVWFTPGLLALGCRQVVVRASYAVGDSRSPVTVAVGGMVLNVVGNVVLTPVMGLSGIALATSVSLVAAAVANGWLLRRRHRGLDGRPVIALLLRAVVLAAAGTAAGLAVRAVAVELPALAQVVVVAAVVAAVHALGLVLLRAPERRLPGEMLRAARRR
ncbi:murein biosynthesis integral membrane protein MurJ [Cellulomonas sp. ATA003]|uniref:murein biosynthesis integral membrane protein MurJ n=1 Tax=Cellulomonas sp. ATA003 TaxID=3073064 RepID=UPI002873DFFC|nr:murein biosynthesis integral membrane protein MurJ [Cellulomonas sp. ATA003]WNB85828.1 murein biosynthesis integral membrane protein MurJ [Cellulomonas sp. ATA003]